MSRKYSLRSIKSDTEKELYPDVVRHLPTFSVTVKDLPEIKNWQVGKKYMVEMEVEMTSSSKEAWERELTARFEIHKIGCEDEDDEMTKQAKRGHQ